MSHDPVHSRSEPSRMVLFPGLGADARLFRAQREAMPWIETPDWAPPRPRDSLRSYARRWAEALKIDSRTIVGGLSMGGMVALEAARHAGAHSCVLMGSCRHPSAANFLLRACEPLSRAAPEAALDKGRIFAPLFLGRRATISTADRRLLATMAQELPVSFIRWAARAIIEWEGCPDPGVPVHHAHGDRDWVIRLVRVRPTHVIKGGAHILNMSHPAEVNTFLAGVMNAGERAGAPSTEQVA